MTEAVNLNNLIGREKVCPICKKIFICNSGEWAYRKGTRDHFKFFCSWGCLRKYEGGGKTKLQRRMAILDELEKGTPVPEIVKKLAEDPSLVNYWKKRLESDRL